MRVLARRARSLSSGHDGGFTLIEVVIAGALLALTTVAVIALARAASQNNYRAEQSQVVNDRLQQEMEAIKQLPYSQVALTSAPAHSSDPTSPNSRVSGTQFNINRTGPASNWNLVYNGGHSNETGGTVSGGAIPLGPTSFQSGNVSGQVYRYVVWKPEVSCLNCAHFSSSDSYGGQSVAWFKHVVIAVTLNTTASGGARSYQEIQSDVGNPDAGQDTCTGNGCPGKTTNDATPWTFWLTDSPCSSDTRQAIAGNHLTHNTFGRCADGVQNTAVPGAPDLMYPQGAPCANDDCNTSQPLYDYATEVEPGCTGVDCSSQDHGLSLVPPSTNGCLLNTGLALAPLTSALELPTSEVNPQTKAHKWVSAQIPSGFNDIVLDGTGSLDLWTQASQSNQSGKICIWLFTRHLDSQGLPVDVPATSGAAIYQTFSQTPWPSGGWSEIHVPLTFTQLTLPVGYRLGLAIEVEKAGTSASGLDFAYDHPTYDSRLVVNTHSALPF